MSQTVSPQAELRKLLFAAVEHLDHVLPGQAPILNFVHHNTLHGFQHLPFFQALEAVRKLTGIHGFLPETQFRQIYRSGRINESDLAVAFSALYENQQDLKILSADRSITRLEVYRIALIHGIEAIEPGPFNWQVEELDALNRFQQDIPAAIRDPYLQTYPIESALVQSLWAASLGVFGLDYDLIHPEELIDLPMQEAEMILAELNPGETNPAVCTINPGIHPQARAEALAQLNSLFASVGKGLSLPALLRNLTGVDLLNQIRPVLIRFCASLMDEGLSAWQAPQRERGLYAAWKSAMAKDATFSLLEIPNWGEKFAALPELSVDAVALSLRELQIPENRWKDYLERIALEIPGWSGMMNWRSHHAEYPAHQKAPVSIMDYLAIRLFLDQLWLEQLSRKTWGIAGNFGSLKAFFERNSSELLTRKLLYAGELPEYLSNSAQKLVALSAPGHHKVEDWRNLADLIWAYQHSKAAVQTQGHDVYTSVWRLFRLAQHLGLNPSQVQGLTLTEAETLLTWLDKFGASERGQIWLLAYEHHYRAQLFNALAQNHGRGRWKQRQAKPSAQAIFCMDDREESIRRHLEEIDPNVETLGAAGFFGVAMNWLGLDDPTPTALCPIVVTPAHEIREIPRPDCQQQLSQHQIGRRWVLRLKKLLHQETRRNLLTSAPLVGLFSPLAFISLLGKTLFPLKFDHIVQGLEENFSPAVPTTLQLTASGSGEKPTTAIQLGFTDQEQADRVGGFLRNIGLTSGFAPLVVVVGHGSSSQNNPHLAAYDCGACSGRHGGPNARTFAAMANRAEVRGILAERGISIPGETWFLGSEHNTCNEDFQWFDLDLMPARFKPAWDRLQTDLTLALHFSAHERCRRLASAPRHPTLAKAMAHIAGRSADFSQARPELGHATNAAAVIGRRSVTRGAFFDRRVFLISYDPSLDPEGSILEGILLAAGPVGAGINLEYYFSTVDNERFGCGSKVPHNVTGLFGVMEGTSSDLRTGLPRQMIEIHEAMRLNVVCEATEQVLTGIYRRQQPLRELIGNGWFLLSAIHPETGVISCFDPQKGFVPWQNSPDPLPLADRSADWYEGHSEPLSPALINLPDQQEVRHAA